MKKIFLLCLAYLVYVSIVFAQPSGKSQSYNIETDRILYTVGYAHLDTQWNWDYPTTIAEYIKNTMTENFALFEKFPEYTFNFTGSRRYKMMKEYYPELYERVIQYVRQGRWHVSGSSVDEGEVNCSGAESIIRQVLYGNGFFKEEFGTASSDYMLPDCFGFIASLPTILNHCGVLGFSTQKLSWGSASGIPFNVGVWNGPDGKGVISAFNATDYTGGVSKRLDLDDTWGKRISDNFEKYGFSFDYRYYGVGDQGGAPRVNDIKHAIQSLNNADSKFKVLLASSDQMYKDITPGIREKLPTYSGDLLLTEHSSGSLTSQAFMKRINRKNELLAQSAEQAATFADFLRSGSYPYKKLRDSWELVLGNQMHDILPGTSIPKAYEYAWNDEFIAANGFSEVLKHSVGAITSRMDTEGNGRAVIIYNPVPHDRDDIATAELTFTEPPKELRVLDASGREVPSQITERTDNNVRFIFQAKVPSLGVTVFHVQNAAGVSNAKSTLKVDGQSLENEFYRVKISSNGDIISIYDKITSREILSGPANLQFLHESPELFPAWNMDWNDRQQPPIAFLDQNATISVIEKGPVRIAIKVTREGKDSKIIQILQLSIGDAGKRLEINNSIDWHSSGVSLKAAFPMTVANDHATYNLGVGTIERDNNNKLQYEVPSREWFDLTDRSGGYGVSILEDCKYGSDKPDDSTLRLTLLYAPEVNEAFIAFAYQGSQDWGRHEVNYAVYGHSGDWRKGQSFRQAKFFNQPLMAFEAPKHKGSLGKKVSFLGINTPQVGLLAFKKMEQGDYYIIRVNELMGVDSGDVKITLPGKIIDAYEVNGQEQKIGPATFSENTLRTDLTHYSLKTFAVKLKPYDASPGSISQMSIALPFNQDVMSNDKNRIDGSFKIDTSGSWPPAINSMPAEFIPDEIVTEGIVFKMGSLSDEENNAVYCDGQTIDIPSGDYTKLYILTSAEKDTEGVFKIDDSALSLSIQAWDGYIGQFYNRELSQDMTAVTAIKAPYVKEDSIAWFASHTHWGYPSKNQPYNYCYLYKYEIDLPKGAKKFILPKNNNIKIFSVTVANPVVDTVQPLVPLYDTF
jgi:alpha-mannosidase